MLPISSNKNREKLVYPALDMHGSSRFSNQRVNNAKIALMKHKKKIRIENINNNF